MRKRTNKRAVALISLVIAIIVLIMLAGLVTYVSNDMISESKRTVFASDLSTVYDSVQEYYAVNGDIPVLEGGLEMDADTYKSKITNTEFLQALTSELIKNEDQAATFYEVDMEKIGIEDSNLGVKANDKDLFLISNQSQLIYYYPGYKINGSVYFSNSYILNK